MYICVYIFKYNTYIYIEKIYICIYIYDIYMYTYIYIYVYIYTYSETARDVMREVGGWGRDPKKCTGRDWGMGSSTI